MYEARKKFKGIDTHFEIQQTGQHKYVAHVNTTKKHRNIPQHVMVEVDTKNHSVRLNGEPVGSFLLALKEEMGRKRSIKKSKRRGRRPKIEHVNMFKVFPPKNVGKKVGRKRLIVVDDEDPEQIAKLFPKVEPTYFDMIKGFFGLVASASAWVLWVIQQCVSFIYYEIIDWGPLSLPIFAIVLGFFFPETIEQVGIFTFSFITQPKDTITKIIWEFVKEKFLMEIQRWVPAFDFSSIPINEVLYEGAKYRIVMKGVAGI